MQTATLFAGSGKGVPRIEGELQLRMVNGWSPASRSVPPSEESHNVHPDRHVSRPTLSGATSVPEMGSENGMPQTVLLAM